MTEVLIVEDERLIRELFAQYIRCASDRYTLADATGDANNAELVCRSRRIDLILMDICTANGASGLDAAQRIKKLFPNIKILLVTSAPEFRFLEKARAAGADSFWYKETDEADLLDVMDRTMAGESVYPDRTPEVPIGFSTSYHFTPKELETLYWLAKVVSAKAIAEQMGVSVDCVNEHLKHLKAKTGCTTKTQLAILACKARLVLPEY
ncbi:MAG: response regulator [Acutalibacteraceae bacterium]